MGAAGTKQHMCSPELLETDLSGKVIIVTGGNSGIGLVAAKQPEFTKQGATVVLTSRDIDAGNKCAEECNEEAASSGKGGKAEAMRLDLADLKTVEAFAKEFKAKHKKLHVLLNNAGVMAIQKRELSKQGYEMQFATNHIGHFLLTNLLTDVLLKGLQGAPSRVVNVSSCASDGVFGNPGAIGWDDLSFEQRKYDPLVSYCQSKLANVLHAMELDKRLSGSGVNAVSLHPGVIQTNLGRHMPIPDWLKPFLAPIFGLLGMQTIDQWAGAQTSIFCCLDESIPSNGGGYYTQVGSGPYPSLKGKLEQGWPMEKHPNPEVSPENAERLWGVTEKLVKDGLAQ